MPACARQQHCALCGILLLGKKRRLFCPTEGVKFVRRQCKPTPFLHAFLEATLPSQPAKLGLCIPCVNWKRRAERGTLKRTARPMLQLDQMILFLMQPGKHQEPDHRCMERLVEAVRQPCNPYRSRHRFFFRAWPGSHRPLIIPGTSSPCPSSASRSTCAATRTSTAWPPGGSTTAGPSSSRRPRRPAGCGARSRPACSPRSVFF